MSKLYIDITKDRVYVEKADSKARRSAQSAMYMILGDLTKLLAPILPFTTEEIWAAMPHKASDDTRSVMLTDMPSYREEYHFGGIEAHWNRLFDMRDDVMKKLEEARADKLIGKSLDAKVRITTADREKYDMLLSFGEAELETVFIVSEAEVCFGETESVEVMPAEGEKCGRCWKYSKDVTPDGESFLCPRCRGIVES